MAGGWFLMSCRAGSPWWRWVLALFVVCASSQAAVASAVASSEWGTTFDPTFGDRGVVAAQLAPGTSSVATSVAVAGDGDVLVGAALGSGASTSGELVRLLPDGAFDGSFGLDGQVALPAPSGVTEVAAAGGGRIFALGGSLVELNVDGEPDASFGSAGVAVLPPSFAAWRFAVAPAGQIVVIGTVSLAGGDSAQSVVRLTAAGEPDGSFGTDGLFVLPDPVDQAGVPLSSVALGGLAVQPDGAIVVREASPLGFDLPLTVLQRVSASGAIDSTFGQDGQATIAGDSNDVGTYNPVLEADGTILVTDYEDCGGVLPPQFPAIWAVTPRGDELTPPAPGACTEEGPPPGALVALPDGNYLAVGVDCCGVDVGGTVVPLDLVSLWLFASNLEAFPDASEPLNGAFYGDQIVAVPGAVDPDGSLLALEPDGRLIFAGSAPAANGQQQMFVARVLGVSQAIVSLPSQPIRREPRSITLRLRCAPAQACLGRAELTEPHLLVGSGGFAIPPAASEHVTITLTPRGLSRLRDHPLNRVTLTLSPAHGPKRTATLIVPGTT